LGIVKFERRVCANPSSDYTLTLYVIGLRRVEFKVVENYELGRRLQKKIFMSMW